MCMRACEIRDLFNYVKEISTYLLELKTVKSENHMENR